MRSSYDTSDPAEWLAQSARPDAATLQQEIGARLGHDEHCPKACCLDCAAQGCNCETAEITGAVMAVLAEHGLVDGRGDV